MKLLTGALLSAALLATTPAFAGRDRDRDDDHDRGHDRRYWKQSKHYKHHRPPQYVLRQDVYHYYDTYQPAPVYYAPPAPVGIHVMLPNIFIPIR